MSELDICNGALILIGAEPISSLDEENDKARACRVLYPSSRDELLRMHPWNFAKKRVALVELATTPLSEYDHQYQLPVDCLRVLENDSEYRDWKIEGRALLTDSTEVIISYISRIEDPNAFDVLFTEALEHRLGSKLAIPIRNSPETASALKNEFFHLLMEARIANAHEGTMAQVWDDDITRRRISNFTSQGIPWYEGG